MLRIIYNDKRQKLYDQICALVDESPRSAFLFHQAYMDRTEGRPGRKGNPLTPPRSAFVLTTKDGQEIEMLPWRNDERVKAAAVPVTGEDAMILGPSTSLVRV